MISQTIRLLALAMEGVVDTFGQRSADAAHPSDIFHSGAGQLLQPTELLEQLPPAFLTDAGDAFQD